MLLNTAALSSMKNTLQGLGCGVWGLRSEVWVLGVGFWGLGGEVYGLGFRVKV